MAIGKDNSPAGLAAELDKSRLKHEATRASVFERAHAAVERLKHLAKEIEAEITGHEVVKACATAPATTDEPAK